MTAGLLEQNLELWPVLTIKSLFHHPFMWQTTSVATGIPKPLIFAASVVDEKSIQFMDDAHMSLIRS